MWLQSLEVINVNQTNLYEGLITNSFMVVNFAGNGESPTKRRGFEGKVTPRWLWDACRARGEVNLQPVRARPGRISPHQICASNTGRGRRIWLSIPSAPTVSLSTKLVLSSCRRSPRNLLQAPHSFHRMTRPPTGTFSSSKSDSRPTRSSSTAESLVISVRPVYYSQRSIDISFHA